MNWEQIQGKWQEYRGQVKQRWGKLTDNDLTVIQGKREVLAGKLLTTYGTSKEQIEKEIAAFEAACKTCDTATPKATARPQAAAKPKAEEAESSGSV
jgi:uncharacterized protein YjbJ (UPF0337 family)